MVLNSPASEPDDVMCLCGVNKSGVTSCNESHVS